MITLCREIWRCCAPKKITPLCLPGHSGDNRTLDKLLDGTNVTVDDNHMWLAPLLDTAQACVYALDDSVLSSFLMALLIIDLTVLLAQEDSPHHTSAEARRAAPDRAPEPAVGAARHPAVELQQDRR